MPLIRFLPSREDHLSSLNKVTFRIGDAAQLLVEIFEAPAKDVSSQSAHISEIKRECDDITEKLSKSLAAAFITELDREDLHALATGLSDLIYLIEALARDATSNFKGDYPPQMRALAKLIKEMALELNTLVPTISEPAEIRDGVRMIRRLQRQARNIHGEGLSRSFRAGENPRTAMIHKDLYASLASAIGSCRDVGQLVELIAIKNV